MTHMAENGFIQKPRRKPYSITKADRQARRSYDLLKRNFSADKPLISYCSMTDLAYPKNSSPAVVSVIPFLERMKISKPISFSIACIADGKLGCDIYSFFIASFRDRYPAIVIVYFN